MPVFCCRQMYWRYIRWMGNFFAAGIHIQVDVLKAFHRSPTSMTKMCACTTDRQHNGDEWYEECNLLEENLLTVAYVSPAEHDLSERLHYKSISNSTGSCQMAYTQIASFMRPTWYQPGSCRPQMGPMWAPRNLLSGYVCVLHIIIILHIIDISRPEQQSQRRTFSNALSCKKFELWWTWHSHIIDCLTRTGKENNFISTLMGPYLSITWPTIPWPKLSGNMLWL